MTAGNEKSAEQRVWEPPLLMRLTAPGDARGITGCQLGSGNPGGCIGGSGALQWCDAGGGGAMPG